MATITPFLGVSNDIKSLCKTVTATRARSKVERMMIAICDIP